MVTRLKVCCIASLEEAQVAIRLGATALGLVSEMPSGPGAIPEARIAGIAARIPPPIGTFLLTSRIDPDAIVEQVRRCGVNTVQLCDRLPEGTHAVLRRDTGLGTLEVLPGVVDAVGGRLPVLIDGGFRRGPDFFKALALGASAVGVGRPYLWGLAAFGQEGVEAVLSLL